MISIYCKRHSVLHYSYWVSHGAILYYVMLCDIMLHVLMLQCLRRGRQRRLRSRPEMWGGRRVCVPAARAVSLHPSVHPLCCIVFLISTLHQLIGYSYVSIISCFLCFTELYYAMLCYIMFYLRASGSGRQPQRRMARLQISGHYAYPAVRSDVTSAPHFCPRATAAGCHADSLSCPLTQLYIPGVPGRVQRGSRGSRGFATSRKHEK